MHVPDRDYHRIAEAIASETSPVGIDAEKTHVVILHMLEEILERLDRLEEEVSALRSRQ